MKGDIDGDGVITSIDAMWAAQYVAGTRQFTKEQLHRADVNCDNNVDSMDAMMIAQYVAGTRTSFPCLSIPSTKFKNGDLLTFRGDLIKINGEPSFNTYGIFVYPLIMQNGSWYPNLSVQEIDAEGTIYTPILQAPPTSPVFFPTPPVPPIVQAAISEGSQEIAVQTVAAYFASPSPITHAAVTAQTPTPVIRLPTYKTQETQSLISTILIVVVIIIIVKMVA